MQMGKFYNRMEGTQENCSHCENLIYYVSVLELF